MKLNPKGDRIVVKRQKAEEQTPGGIIIPDAAKKKTARGEVLAVGPGRMNDEGARVEMSIKPGDIAVFGDYSGTELKLDGEELIVLREDDVLGTIEN